MTKSTPRNRDPTTQVRESVNEGSYSGSSLRRVVVVTPYPPFLTPIDGGVTGVPTIDVTFPVSSERGERVVNTNHDKILRREISLPDEVRSLISTGRGEDQSNVKTQMRKTQGLRVGTVKGRPTNPFNESEKPGPGQRNIHTPIGVSQ